MGKPVLCYVSEDVRKQMHPSMPVVSVTPETLHTVLRGVLSSADLRAELGERGIEYVKQHHNPKTIAERCLEVYETS